MFGQESLPTHGPYCSRTFLLLWAPVGDMASGAGRRPQFSYSCLPGQVQPQVRAISSGVAVPIRGKAISALGYVGAHMLVHLIQPGWGRKLVVGMKAKDREDERTVPTPVL